MFTPVISVSAVGLLVAGLPLLANKYGDRPMTAGERDWMNLLGVVAVVSVTLFPLLERVVQ